MGARELTRRESKTLCQIDGSLISFLELLHSFHIRCEWKLSFYENQLNFLDALYPSQKLKRFSLVFICEYSQLKNSLKMNRHSNILTLLIILVVCYIQIGHAAPMKASNHHNVSSFLIDFKQKGRLGLLDRPETNVDSFYQTETND